MIFDCCSFEMKFYLFNIFIVIITLSYQSTFFWCSDNFTIEYLINIEEDIPSEKKDTSKKGENQLQIIPALSFVKLNTLFISTFKGNPHFSEIYKCGAHPFSIEIPPEV
jgi:hypothetical protein